MQRGLAPRARRAGPKDERCLCESEFSLSCEQCFEDLSGKGVDPMAFSLFPYGVRANVKTPRRSRGPGNARLRLRFKPRLELLEDRTLLSTLIVTNNLDDGSAGSLRDAVRLANLGPGGDTIDFAPSLSGQTIHMNPASGTFALNKGVTITADGLDDMVAIDGVFG